MPTRVDSAPSSRQGKVAGAPDRPDRPGPAYAAGMPGSARADLPEDFAAALAALQSARIRPEVSLVESPAPQKLAPYAVAVSATVTEGPDEVAHGRLIVLCDPAGQQAWGGRMRLVTYIRTSLEAEMVTDPMLPEVAWSWLAETLASHGVELGEASGTVTRVQSHPFGELVGDDEEPAGPAGELEIRASWSPAGEMAAHVAGWIDVLCLAGGLPPPSPGVVAIPTRRTGRAR